MQIRDISLDDIRLGKNWKVLSAEEFDWTNDVLENLSIIEATDFGPEDLIVYSAVSVTDAGNVTPLVMIKQVEDLDYGGDYCEFEHGTWKQLGLVPNPSAPNSEMFVANPLQQDDSFISEDDYRAYHRQGFLRFVQKLQLTLCLKSKFNVLVFLWTAIPPGRISRWKIRLASVDRS